MQRKNARMNSSHYVALHGPLGSYLRDAFYESMSHDVVAYMPRGLQRPSYFLFFVLVVSTTFLQSGRRYDSSPNDFYTQICMSIARIPTIYFCCSPWNFGFLSSRCFARGQCRCCGVPPCSSGSCVFLRHVQIFPPFPFYLIGGFHCFLFL
jgi:hypothetical protein